MTQSNGKASGAPADVCIIGAGPAGSTCAFYLARQGVSVLLLDKERFPRDKLCGDAVCSPAHVHLRRMGVLQAIEAEGRGNWARVGGMFGPNGTGYIGNSTDETREPLVEEYPVGSVEFSPAEGLWTVHHRNQALPPFRARALVAADGALSRVARSLGLVNEPPEAICSRNYIDARTANFDADGVVFYPP